MSLKAQEASLTDRLNTLNIRQRDDGVSAVALEFDRMDLARAETYLDTIVKNLADLKIQVRVGARPAEAYQSLSELRVWDVASDRTTRALIEPGGWIAALAFTRDGTSLIAGGGTPGTPGSVTLFDLAPRPARIRAAAGRYSRLRAPAPFSLESAAGREARGKSGPRRGLGRTRRGLELR